MTPALLLIDLQNDFLAAPGLQPAAGQIVERAAVLLNACRRLAVPVIHVLTTTKREPDNRMPHWKAAGRWLCEDGTPGHAPPEPLRPETNERIVHKQCFSGFGNPALESFLQSLKCDTLLLTGVHLHGCVRATALDAYQHGYQIWIVEDAVGSDDPLHAAITRRWLAKRAARFVSVARVSRELAGIGCDGGGNRLEHRAPHDHGRVLWQVQIDECDEVAAAAAAARAAWRASRGNDPRQRADGLRRLAELLTAEAHALARQITEEIGKPIMMAHAEVQRSAAILQAVADRAGEPLTFRSGPGANYRYQPLGVVGIVTPWNNPVAIPVGKIAPPLLYGNSVVWKPAPAATMIARNLLNLLRAAGWKDDLIRLCTGDQTTACALAEDPLVDGVTLSGSLQAGYALQEICNRRHVPFQGELGGNNAAIVWDDADLRHAAGQVAAGAFGFAGQRCTANRRVIVAESCFDLFVDALKRAVRDLRWGDPFHEATVVGPLISIAKRNDVAALLERTQTAGADVSIPHRNQPDYADLLERGAYHPPALVFAEDPNCEIVQEETFGPVLVVQRAGSFDHALVLVNGVRQGLVAALFSASPARREQFLVEARAGVLKINRSTADADAVSPLGGWKASGVGPAEHGPSDREFFCRVQTIYHVQPHQQGSI